MFEVAVTISPRKILGMFMLLVLIEGASVTCGAQQPFFTDDADVTEKGKFHMEFRNEFDVLQRSSYPSLRQNTADLTLAYGFGTGIELGVESPIISIFNSHVTIPKTAMGIGDTNVYLKYNFLKEREGSWLPAMAATMNIEFPTGDERRQLGSGLTDYWLNTIMQKSLSEQTKLRLNAGILFAGNTLTGVIGIKSRGRVFTGGASIVKQFTDKLDFGAEVTGEVTSNFLLSRGQLQFLVGGNYALKKNLTLDFGLIGGRFPASPRVGAQLGFSADF